MDKEIIISENTIKSKIHNIRGLQVILDYDLAEFYEVLTGNLNKAVKRNFDRFPEDFMFQLTKKEFENLIFQNGTSNWGGTRKLPYAFTEQGVATLSGILKSKKAVEMNILIMRAFVSMRNFLINNAQIFRRLDKIETKQLIYDEQFEKVFNALDNHEPKQGIFFDGEIFDSYKFVSGLIKNANKKIILIDNFVDESVLVLFGKRKKDVSVTIYTKDITKQLKLDLEKFNSQYENIDIKEFKKSHDRFLIIDDKDVYHIGASLKDLGKKWFAFSKMQKDSLKILERLG